MEICSVLTGNILSLSALEQICSVNSVKSHLCSDHNLTHHWNSVHINPQQDAETLIMPGLIRQFT